MIPVHIFVATAVLIGPLSARQTENVVRIFGCADLFFTAEHIFDTAIFPLAQPVELGKREIGRLAAPTAGQSGKSGNKVMTGVHPDSGAIKHSAHGSRQVFHRHPTYSTPNSGDRCHERIRGKGETADAGLSRGNPHEHQHVAGRQSAGRLDYPRRAVKSATYPSLKNDLKEIRAATKLEVVYTHNPADKHDAHIGAVIAPLQAMRELPAGQRPKKVIGFEVWRNLDWLPDAEKVVTDVSGHDNLAAAKRRLQFADCRRQTL